ncbi:uncharacterized protein LOC123910304 [Trifolium pratense]|uniref:uncharacterized protein LOC123910304 n=1 Tax=Trifolium pratense TaxID=57577 RepID=UPI001E690307|nr:uncharacterized protein LOC123910304 [Trifolium pratense]
MGNCCKAEYSSMEWDGEDWESLRSSSNQSEKPAKAFSSSSRNKVFDEESANLDHHKKNDLLGKLRGSCDANGKVTLKISKCELAELLGAIQNSNNQQPPQNQMKKKKELACAEQVLFRLMKAREHEIAKKHHCSGHWKPMLDTIAEC